MLLKTPKSNQDALTLAKEGLEKAGGILNAIYHEAKQGNAKALAKAGSHIAHEYRVALEAVREAKE